MRYVLGFIVLLVSDSSGWAFVCIYIEIANVSEPTRFGKSAYSCILLRIACTLLSSGSVLVC